MKFIHGFNDLLNGIVWIFHSKCSRRRAEVHWSVLFKLKQLGALTYGQFTRSSIRCILDLSLNRGIVIEIS